MDDNTLNILFKRVANGDAQAFRQVYDEWYQPLYNYAFAYTKRSELASDVIQHIFLKLWERREILDEVDTPAAWLYSAARFQAFKILQREMRQETYLQLVAEEMKENSDTMPQRPLELQQTEKLVRDVLEGLTEKQRQAFVLSRFEGMSYRQIAELWQISIPTVKEHVTKAAKAVREKLQSMRSDLIGLWVMLFLV